MNRIKSITLFVMLACFQPVFGQIGGSASFAFVDIAPTASLAALGGAGMSFYSKDISVSMLNPAMHNPDMNHFASLSYTNYLKDINVGYAGFAKHWDSIGTFSGHISFIEYGEFDKTTVEGKKIGTFRATDYVFQVGYGNTYQKDNRFTYGASFKFLYSVYETYVATAGAFDFAAAFHNHENKFHASLLIRNLGYNFIPYNDVREKLPTDVQLGLSKKLAHNPLRFSIVAHSLQRWDLSYINPNLRNKEIELETGKVKNAEIGFFDNAMRHFNFGIALVFSENFQLRGGYNYQRRQELAPENTPGATGFSWGFGVGIKKFKIDYAMASYFRGIHVSYFTISKNINDFKRAKPENL